MIIKFIILALLMMQRKSRVFTEWEQPRAARRQGSRSCSVQAVQDPREVGYGSLYFKKIKKENQSAEEEKKEPEGRQTHAVAKEIKELRIARTRAREN